MRIFLFGMLFSGLILVEGCGLYPGWPSRVKNSPKPQMIQLDEVKILPKPDPNRNQEPQQIMDILHTDLAVSFHWGKHECSGIANIRLKPYFYETDSLVFDARNMTFSEIKIQDAAGENLEYLTRYNKQKLVLKLERALTVEDTLNIKIRYQAHPDEAEPLLGKAIRDDKGLYFINTDRQEPDKPVQLWTQGEPESNSNWFPTVDKPWEKFTFRLAITVNQELTTLSNGKLISSVQDGGQRTDTWEHKHPIPAYLVMMAVGNFGVVHDSLTRQETEYYDHWVYDTIRVATNDSIPGFRDSIVARYTKASRLIQRDLLNGIGVSYYLEPAYLPYARQIFRHTPEMIDFFGAKLGVEYPWDKYAQVVVRDYVSGAMENTSATLHGETVQKTTRELLDAPNDDIIAHELFHQWFGDLVTCRSWGHLVLNEGFATYGEYLWYEYKYGTGPAQVKLFNSLNRYLSFSKMQHDEPVVRFNYRNPDEMFNAITYQKGALVWHALRQELGDMAFFQALKQYLRRYAMKHAEVDEFRKVCEEVSGRDLRVFFNQWLWRGGHPVLDVRYDYQDSSKLLAITLEQKQSSDMGVFQIPLTFKVSQAGITRYFTFELKHKTETFYVQKFDPQSAEKPNVFIDPHGSYIGEIIDNKPFINHIRSFHEATGTFEKLRSLQALSLIQESIDSARKTLFLGLHDPLPECRIKSIEWINWKIPVNMTEGRSSLMQLALKDTVSRVRAKAIATLSGLNDLALFELFSAACQDSSYAVAAQSLQALYNLDSGEGLQMADQLQGTARRDLFQRITEIYAQSGTRTHSRFFEDNLLKVSGRNRATFIEQYARFCTRFNLREVQDKAILLLNERAYNERLPRTRAAAILGLYTIWQSLQSEIRQSTVTGSNSNRQAAAATLQESLWRIIQQEKHPETLELLRKQGLPESMQAEMEKVKSVGK